MNKKIAILSILVGALLIMGATGEYLFFQRQASLEIKNNTQVVPQDLTRGGCLGDDEMASYKMKEKENNYADAVITVIKKNNSVKRDIFVEDVRTSYHPVEIHHCGAYLIKEFGVDYKRSQFSAGFNWTLWRYDYRGGATKLLTFAEKVADEEPKVYYPTDFRVDFLERYITLIKGYSGRDDYALIIKDLKTLKDAFVLPVAEIVKRNPEVGGDIGFSPGGWTDDGKFLWIDISIGAEVYGFVRINSLNWTYEVFKAPPMTMGGDAFNIDTGMVTYGEDVAPWSGVVEIDEQLQKEAIQNGKISSFYIYNLFTKKKYLVATTTDPTYYFRPQWLSDTELQYEMPSGERKVYKIKE